MKTKNAQEALKHKINLKIFFVTWAFPYWGGGGGVWQSGKNSHVLSFFVLESLPKGRSPVPICLFFYKVYKWPLTPPRPLFIKVRTTFFKTVFFSSFSVLEIGRQMALPLQFFFKRFSSMKIFKFLQGLVGFGNLRFAEIKSCPSASPTYELRKVEISCQKWLFMHILCCKLCPPEHNKSGTNFFINGFDPPPPVYNNYKKTDVLVF